MVPQRQVKVPDDICLLYFVPKDYNHKEGKSESDVEVIEG